VPAVAERTAARIAPLRIVRASSGRFGSVQIGTLRRYRAGVPSGGNQPTPKPSAFTVPWRCMRGAHDC
jgi:hypothetical protein